MTFERPELLFLLALVPAGFALALTSRAERPRGGRRIAAGALRAATLAALALAAAGPVRETVRPPRATAFVLDGSASVGSAGVAEGVALVRSLEAALPRGERVVHLLAGDEPRIVAQPGGGGGAARETDLAAALALAEATLPEGGRIVLATDGRETRGDAATEAARLAARGIPVTVHPIPGEPPLDARVVAVTADRVEVREGETFAVRVTVATTRPARVRVELARRGASFTREVEVGTEEVLVFPERAGEPGVVSYEARATVAGDAEPGNDRGGTALVVRGGPRALVVDVEGEGEFAARTLAAQGFVVRRTTPAKAPHPDESLDLVVLASGSLLPGAGARALPAGWEAGLERWVRDGGGLIALGGPESFGPGGWHGSALEEALPVTAEPPARGEKPSVALILAIDKSGSMNGPKLELAKLAARNAAWALAREDRLGVIAFNFVAFWVVPLAPLGDRKAVQDRIEMQAAGGGTDLVPSLRAARAALVSVDARIKHLLVLTDGISSNGDVAIECARELARADRITTSTFAVGEDADQELLRRIAAAGEGRHHSVTQIGELPRVVLEETLVAARAATDDESFRAAARRAHPVLARVELEHAPPLHGISPVRAKPLASVLLDGPRGLPLLATWEHGLGRSVAWTSDLAPRWADAFASWEGATRLLGQLARFVARRDGARGVSVELGATSDRDGVLLTAEARHEDGSFANDLALEARIGDRREPLVLLAPGRYEARSGGLEPGTHLASVWLGQVRVASAAFFRGGDRERAVLGVDRAALDRIERAGRAEVGPAPPRRQALALHLLALAAALVPIELAVRRLGA